MELALRRPRVRQRTVFLHAKVHFRPQRGRRERELYGRAGATALLTNRARSEGGTFELARDVARRPDRTTRRPSPLPSFLQSDAPSTMLALSHIRHARRARFPPGAGDVLFAHGHRRVQAATGRIEPPGLWLWSCHCVDPDQPVHASGVAVAPGFQEMVLVASVPLTEESWQPLGEGELVAVSGGRRVDAVGPSPPKRPISRACEVRKNH